MNNRAEAIFFPVSITSLKNEALKLKNLGALLLAAAFAVGMSPAASANGNTISVRVTNIAGVPLAGVGVCACHFVQNGPDSSSQLAQTDATGYSTFTVSGTMRFEILATAQNFLPTIHAQYTNPNHPWVFADDGGGTLTAQVTLSSTNSNGQAVNLGAITGNVTNATPNAVILASIKTAGGASAGDGLDITDGSGSASITVNNVLFKDSNTYVFNVFDPTANKTVPVGVDKTLSVDSTPLSYNVDFANGLANSNIQQQQVSGAGNLSATGVIVDSESIPVPYASIQLCQVNNNSGYNCNSQYWANTDANGRFNVTGLSTGPYSVNINQTCNPNGLVCYQGYNNGSVASPDFTFTGSLVSKTYTLQKMLPGTGKLDVVVSDSFGNILPQSWVSIWPDWNSWNGGDSTNHPGMSNGNAQAPQGIAHFTGLYSGNYIVSVQNNFVATEDGSGLVFNYSASGQTASDGKFQNGTKDSHSYRVTVDESLAPGASVKVYDDQAVPNVLSCHDASFLANFTAFTDNPSFLVNQLCPDTGGVAVSTITVAMPTSNNNSGVIHVHYSFPSPTNLSTPIMISYQVSCNSGNCPQGAGGFKVLGPGSVPQSGTIDIPVLAGNQFYTQINADYWAWNRPDGSSSDVDLSGSTVAYVNMPFVPGGRITGKFYTPGNTLFIPTQTGNSFIGAWVNASGQGPGYGYTQVNNDGSYTIGGLIPGRYTMTSQTQGLNYTNPFQPIQVNVTANQDTYFDMHTVNAVTVQPLINLSGIPPITKQFCSASNWDCRPENYLVKTLPQGTPLTTNATLRNFLNLNSGSDSTTDFGFTFSTNSNGGHGCQNGGSVVPNSFCAAAIPTPGTYDFYAIRADDFAQGISTGPKPSFVILGSTKAFVVAPELSTGGVVSHNNGQQYVSGFVGGTPMCTNVMNFPSNEVHPCQSDSAQYLQIDVSAPSTQQTTLQGAVSAAMTNVFRQQDFDSWGGNFDNFMQYIPIVTLYDASGTLKAAGSILPNPGCLTDTTGQQLQDSVAAGNYTNFINTMKAWVACSASKGIPLGFEIRGLPPATKYNLVLTSPNYPPFQTTVVTGLDKTTTTVAAINLDGLGTGETLVVNVVDTTTMLGIPSAPMVLSGPAYAARTFNANSTGTIAIAGLAASGYTLSIQVPGYALASLNLPLVGTGKLTVNIGLTPASSEISGSVYAQTPSGNVLMPSADVYAYDDTLNAAHAGDPKFSLPLYHTVTSTAGYYTFTGLLSGDTFKVSAKINGYYVAGATVATSGSAAIQDFTLKPKPLDIDVYGKPNGFVYTFTIRNPSDFADGQAWIQFQDPNTGLPPFAPFVATDTSHMFQVNFAKVGENLLQLNYPVGSGFNYNLHIEAQSYGGDTVVKDVPFSHDSLATTQQIDHALVGDDSDSGTGTNLNQVLIDPTGANPSALTIPPGSMIPVGDDIVPTAQFNAINPIDAPEGGVFTSTAVFAGNVYDLTLSSVNFTGTGFDLTVSYDPANTNLNDLDMYVFINDANGVTASALRPQSMYKTKAVGKWWSLKALGFPLTVNAQNHTITVKGLKTLASVLSVKDSPMAAINTGRGFKPNTAYKSLGISPNEKSAFAVMRPSQQVKKPATGPAAKTITANVSSITWTWAAVANAVDYRFYPSTGGNPITVAGLTLTQTGLDPNTAYGGAVSAMNNSGEGPLTKLTTTYTLAAAPTGTSVDQVNVTSMTISWTDGLNPAGTKYSVEFAKQATPNTFTKKASTTTYTILTGLTANTTYFVRVRSVNAKLLSGPNDAVQTVWTFPTKPAAAPAVKINPALTTPVEQLATGQIVFSWAAVPGAAAYNFIPVNGDPTVVTTNTYVIVGSLGNNAAYGAKVQATNINGAGPISAVTTGYALAATPASTLATPAHTSLIVTWDANGAASNTTYQVQYKLHSATAWTSVVSTASVGYPAESKVITALLTGQQYDVRVRSLNVKGIPGVPDATSSATPTVVRTAVAAAPEWKWEIPSGEVAKPGAAAAGTSAALAKVLAFPNPLLAGQPGINFVYVPEGATIKITNPAGTTVHTFTVKGGAATWNGTDLAGHKVANGLYTALIESAGAQRAITLAVQR